jgi:hypothetical protein
MFVKRTGKNQKNLTLLVHQESFYVKRNQNLDLLQHEGHKQPRYYQNHLNV